MKNPPYSFSTLLFSGVVGTLLASVGAAQVSPQVQHGPASALAAGLSLKPLSPSTLDELLFKAPQQQTAFPPSWEALLFPNVPDYSLTALFGSSIAAVIEIDAHSTGNDFLPPLEKDANGIFTGALDVAASGRWVALTVSVADGAQGLPGSWFESRTQMPAGSDSPASDLVTHYLDESTGLHGSLVGATLLEQPSETLGLAGTDPMGNPYDVDALDFGLAVNAYGSPIVSTAFFGNPDQYYFSISSECVAAVNANTVPPNSFDENGDAADPNTVYYLQWDGSSWGLPFVCRSAADLQLNDPLDDLDALAVDSSSGRIVFSSTLLPGTSQLRILDPLGDGCDSSGSGSSPVVLDLKASSGQSLASHTGSNDITDDIDAICLIDPEMGVLGTLMGTPNTVPGSSVPTPMGISVTATGNSSGSVTMRVQASGWGGLSPGAGTIALYFTTGDPSDLSTWSSLGTIPRSAAEELVDWTVTLPLGATFPSLYLAALTINAGGGFNLSWASEIAVK